MSSVGTRHECIHSHSGLVCLRTIHYSTVHVLFFLIFLYFLLLINIKTFSLFSLFYITSIIFYYYSNKKIHYNTKFSLFISHHHFLLISKINNPLSCYVLFCNVTCQTSPLLYNLKETIFFFFV